MRDLPMESFLELVNKIRADPNCVDMVWIRFDGNTLRYSCGGDMPEDSFFGRTRATFNNPEKAAREIHDSVRVQCMAKWGDIDSAGAPKMPKRIKRLPDPVDVRHAAEEAVAIPMDRIILCNPDTLALVVLQKHRTVPLKEAPAGWLWVCTVPVRYTNDDVVEVVRLITESLTKLLDPDAN